jgi:hypothetical protein
LGRGTYGLATDLLAIPRILAENGLQSQIDEEHGVKSKWQGRYTLGGLVDEPELYDMFKPEKENPFFKDTPLNRARINALGKIILDPMTYTAFFSEGETAEVAKSASDLKAEMEAEQEVEAIRNAETARDAHVRYERENGLADEFTQNRATEGAGDAGVLKTDGINRDGSQLENGKLKPNVFYQSGEHDYVYKTNEDGLITNASTDNLQLRTHSGRLNHNPNTFGKNMSDQAGHLFGDRFGGSPELDNLVSQAKRVNQSELKVLENHWASALSKKQKVAVDITINYTKGSARPVSFDVFYTIDGVPFFSSIYN